MAGSDIIERMQAIGNAGFCISISFGRRVDGKLMFCVFVSAPDGQVFERPFACDTAELCLDVAENEIVRRGWIVK